MANTALKKIITQAKKIRKRHKSMSWKSAVKKASVQYKKGGLKTRRKSVGAVKKTRKRRTVKRVVAKRRTVRRKSAPRATRPVVIIAGARRKRRSYAKKRAAPRRRRIGSRKDKFIQTLAIAGLGLGLVIALTRNRQQTAYVPTGNIQRDSKAQQILAFAQQAALSASQIAALISRLNNSSDSQLDMIQQGINSGQPVTAYA